MTATKFVPFTPPPDAPPKRGPGRPKGSKNKSTKSLRKEIEGLVAIINSVFRALAPRDALDSVEVAALAKSLDEQAKVSPRFRRGLESILSATGGTSLGVVIGIIIGRRAARHNLFGVPTFVDDIGGSFIQMMNVSPSEADETMGAILSMFGAATNDGNNEQANSTHSPA